MFKFLVIAALLALTAEAKPRILRSDGRIVGGIPATIEEHPYQVSVQYRRRPHCGGSVIGQRHILSAAHCTDARDWNAFSVRLGSTDVENGGTVIAVYNVYDHFSYNAITTDYDVTVLRLSEDITYSALIQPIPLVDIGSSPGNRTATVTGWGAIDNNQNYPKKLLKVTVNEIRHIVCRIKYRNVNPITDRMICFWTLGKDACGGDSGGPLVSDGKQIGIVSFGMDCADSYYPGVYTDVGEMRSFIDSHLN